MIRPLLLATVAALPALVLAACSDEAGDPKAQYGSDPKLPEARAYLAPLYLSSRSNGLHRRLVGSDLCVANTDAVLRFPYEEGETQITTPGERLTDLPAQTPNHHWTKAMTARPDGSKLHVGVGSNSNITENGIGVEEGRAAICEVDRATGLKRMYASGVRNPTGLAFEPATGQLWTVANERDEIGPDLVPDHLTSVKEDGFYGWPYSYWGQHVDVRVQPQRPELVAKAIKPDYGLGSTWPRSALPSPSRTPFPHSSRTAPSSASTAAGTAIRCPDTRWCSCPSGKESRTAIRSAC